MIRRIQPSGSGAPKGPLRKQIHYIMPNLFKISHFFHTDFGSKVKARRLGPQVP
jgi:hypothetical protein